MVRGCQKRVVFIKNTGSEFFDEAYFVITDTHVGRADDEMISEAKKIIDSARPDIGRRGMGRGVLAALSFVAGSLLTALSVLSFNLFF